MKAAWHLSLRLRAAGTTSPITARLPLRIFLTPLTGWSIASCSLYCKPDAVVGGVCLVPQCVPSSVIPAEHGGRANTLDVTLGDMDDVPPTRAIHQSSIETGRKSIWNTMLRLEYVEVY